MFSINWIRLWSNLCPSMLLKARVISLQLVKANSWVWCQQRQSSQKLNREIKERDVKDNLAKATVIPQVTLHLPKAVPLEEQHQRWHMQRPQTLLNLLSQVTKQMKSQTSLRGKGAISRKGANIQNHYIYYLKCPCFNKKLWDVGKKKTEKVVHTQGNKTKPQQQNLPFGAQI